MQRMNDMIKIKVVKDPPKERRFEAPRREPVQPPQQDNTPKPVRKVKKGPRFMLWFVAILSIVFLFFSFSYTFSSADISVTPKIEEVTVNESFISSKDPTSPVPFDLVVIEGEETKRIQAKEKTVLEVPSKGTVYIYNAFSATPQTLSIDTRLEGSNGKMYKTEKKITVPGMKDGQPGRVEVGIYAGGTGPEYDSEPLDFKIFGFKETPKYEKIYARSKDKISGGVRGEYFTVTDAEKTQALSELKSGLQNKLYKKAVDQIPDGFILFEDAVFLSVKDEASTPAYSKESSVPIVLKGTLYGFLFEEGKLTKKLAENVLEKYSGEDVYLHNLRGLSFSLANKENISFADVKEISFTLSGKSRMVWRFDEAKFTEDLLNKQKKDFNAVLSNYQNVASANLMLRPFWRMSFPSDPKDIKITVNYPK